MFALAPFEVRKLDKMKRVNIPLEIRKAINLKDDSYLQIKIKDGTIVLQPLEPREN